jgi:hypothetical protein
MKFRDYIKESALPAGFEGFGDDEVQPKGKAKKDPASVIIPNEVTRDSIVKIKNTKWLVFRRLSDYTCWAYKYPSKKRKLYELVSTGDKNKFEVWNTGGSGQRLKKKPEVTGKLEIVS